MKKLIALIALALSAAACAGGDTVPTTTPSPSTTVPARLAPGADVVIGSVTVDVTHPNIEPVSYTIDCFGDTFTVTPFTPGIDGAAACARLNDPAVMERLVSGPPADQICTEIYGGEDVAVVTGTLDDVAIDARFDRTNGCGISDWDSLMAGILPPAIGVAG